MSNDFVLPDGSCFDRFVGLGGIPTQRFKGYGVLLEKTRARLHMYGLSARKVDALASIDAEVGDDEIGVDTNPVYAAAKVVVYSDFLGMKVSEEDTSINPRFGNFAEDLVIVPDGYEQTYRYARQTSDFRNMAFLDVPKLRLAIDIRPGRMNHSATNDGKAGILGSRLAWLPRDSPVRCMWEVFNLYQDINLGLCRDDKFAYLPTALGGYGKPVPFGHAPNFDAFCLRYKQGAHAGLARELVRRTNRRFSEYTVEHRFNTDEVLSAVSRLQSSWHDWIKGKSLYAPTCWLEAPPQVAALRVAKHGLDVRVDSALRRLEAGGYLVTESDLAVAWEHNKLCQFLLGADTHEQFVKKREESRKEWLNLSTFSMRLYGLITPLRVDQSLQGPMTDSEYESFWFSITKSKLNLRMFLRQENYYLHEAKDLVYLNGPMKVRVPLYPKVTKMGRRYWFEQTKDTQDETESVEEFESLLEWVLDDPTNTNPPSRRMLDDDPFIIKEIGDANQEDAFCIVTDDIRLCREAFVTTHRWVVRVPVKWYYMALYYGEEPEPWLAKVKDKWPFQEWRTILDTGSIESYEEIGFRDGLPILWPAERPFRMTQRSFNEVTLRRTRAKATSPDHDQEVWEPYRFPEGYSFVPGAFSLRKRHPHRRGWA